MKRKAKIGAISTGTPVPKGTSEEIVTGRVKGGEYEDPYLHSFREGTL